MKFEFEDNSSAIKNKINKSIETYLSEIGMLLTSQTQENSRVNTGRTKGSWNSITYQKENRIGVIVGSELENALWEEFGTGEFALDKSKTTRNGKGWFIPIGYARGQMPMEVARRYWLKNVKDYKNIKFIYTRGKKPTRAFYRAFLSLRNEIKSEKFIKEKMKWND